MKVFWTIYYGKFRKSEYTFQGPNAKRDAKRLVKRLGGRVFRTVVADNTTVNGEPDDFFVA